MSLEDKSPLGFVDFKASASRYIFHSSYEKAFRCLVQGSGAARSAFIKVHSDLLRQEMQNTKSQSSTEHHLDMLEGEVTLSKLEKFSFTEVVDEAREKIPLTFSCLEAVIPTASQIRCKGRKDQKR